MHPSENNSESDPFLLASKKYSDCKIFERFGLNLMEFLSLPHADVEALINEASTALDRELKKQKAEIDKLK
jgi:hypothetical protein